MKTKTIKNIIKPTIPSELSEFIDYSTLRDLRVEECQALLNCYKEMKENFLPSIRDIYRYIPHDLFPILDIAWPLLVSTENLMKKIDYYKTNPDFGYLINESIDYIQSEDCPNPFRNKSKQWLNGEIQWVYSSPEFILLLQKLRGLHPPLKNTKSSYRKAPIKPFSMWSSLLLVNQIFGVFSQNVTPSNDQISSNTNNFSNKELKHLDAKIPFEYIQKAALSRGQKDYNNTLYYLNLAIATTINNQELFRSYKERFLISTQNFLELGKHYSEITEYEKASSAYENLRDQTCSSDTTNSESQKPLSDALNIIHFFTSGQNTLATIKQYSDNPPLKFDDIWFNLTEKNFAPTIYEDNPPKLLSRKLIDTDNLLKKVNINCNKVNLLYDEMRLFIPSDGKNWTQDLCQERMKLGYKILEMLAHDAYFNLQVALVLSDMIHVNVKCGNHDQVKAFKLALGLYKLNPHYITCIICS